MPATIAVIDDDAAYIRFMERALDALGYRCQAITTFDIDDAVRIIDEGSFDAAIVDVFMYNRASGFACIDAIRKKPNGGCLPLIVASGEHGKLARETSFLRDAGCVALPKPFGLDELTRALQEASTIAPAPVLLPPLLKQPATGVTAAVASHAVQL